MNTPPPICCSYCGRPEYHVYLPCLTNSEHQHLVCMKCLETFGDGVPGNRHIVCIENMTEEQEAMIALSRMDE